MHAYACTGLFQLLLAAGSVSCAVVQHDSTRVPVHNCVLSDGVTTSSIHVMWNSWISLTLQQLAEEPETQSKTQYSIYIDTVRNYVLQYIYQHIIGFLPPQFFPCS